MNSAGGQDMFHDTLLGNIWQRKEGPRNRRKPGGRERSEKKTQASQRAREPEREREREREREKQQHPVLTYCMGLFLNIGIRGGLILSLVAVPISLCVCCCMCNEELE